MVRVEFEAPEYRADATFEIARFRFDGSADRGFEVWRNGARWLEVGPGYRLLRTVACGVCSTDLDRQFLPFRLPQVTGHEVVAVDHAGRRHVVEINASPRARGLRPDCPDCADGLDRHCPERLVLGIHDLPGGFGSWILAPVRAAIPVPEVVATDAALLVEPFAAALRAVDRIDIRDGERVAVLGPRKLGMLALAALGARRRQRGARFTIVARARRAELADVATRMGADEVLVADLHDGEAVDDVVVDTTGSPDGFAAALRLAGREVHLKSTHGRPAGGLRGSTAFVVDELELRRYDEAVLDTAGGVAWLSADPPPSTGRIQAGREALPLRARFRPRPGGCIAGAAVAVVDDLAGADDAIRPSDRDEVGLVRPTGTILLRHARGGPLAEAVFDRGLRLTSSRCGDFRHALALLEQDGELRAAVASLITDRFGAGEIQQAFDAARSRDCIKAVVDQPGGGA